MLEFNSSENPEEGKESILDRNEIRSWVHRSLERKAKSLNVSNAKAFTKENALASILTGQLTAGNREKRQADWLILTLGQFRQPEGISTSKIMASTPEARAEEPAYQIILDSVLIWDGKD